MSRQNLMAVPVASTGSVIYLTLIGHDHKVARTLGHAPGTGRWIDQYEVKRTADLTADPDGKELIPAHKDVTPDLDAAREIASELYRDAAARYARLRWWLAELECPHFHPDQDINGR